MSEQCEIFRAMAEHRQAKRRANNASSTEILRKNGIEFVSKNNGAHLIIGQYNFWPSTGLFIHRKTNARGRGVFNLLKTLQKDQPCQNT